MKAVLSSLIACLACLCASDVAGQRLEIGKADVMVDEGARLPVSLSTDVPVQGVLAVFEWDGDAGTGLELIFSPEVRDAADFLNGYVADDWMALGITAVTSPLTGVDLPLATSVIHCDGGRANADIPVRFTDDAHRVPGSILSLANTITVDQRSIRREDGLELVDGRFRCVSDSRGDAPQLALGRAESTPSGEVRIPLDLSTDDAVQGIQAVFEWDGEAGVGVDLIVDEAVAEAANFVNVHVDSSWMAVGVTTVTSPLVGEGLRLATAVIRCGAAPGSADHTISFRDGVHSVPGSPVTLKNLVTVGGRSVRRPDGLQLVDGGFQCMPPPPVPDIDVTPPRLDYGRIAVGASKTLEVTIRNVGAAELEVSDVIFDEATSPDFTLSDAPVTPTVIAPGEETTVSITYTPQRTELDEGRLVVRSNDADETEISVTLSGEGETDDTPFRRGDVNADGTANIADAIGQLANLFAGGPAPMCLESADANDDGSFNISDPTFLLNYLFEGGMSPPQPGPDACGPNPVVPGLGCDVYESC